jgi:hypothetical protein
VCLLRWSTDPNRMSTPPPSTLYLVPTSFGEFFHSGVASILSNRVFSIAGSRLQYLHRLFTSNTHNAATTLRGVSPSVMRVSSVSLRVDNNDA